MTVAELKKALEHMSAYWKTRKITECDKEFKEEWVVETLDPQAFNSFSHALDDFLVKFEGFEKQLSSKISVAINLLKEVAEKRGAYSQNHLQHAENVIENASKRATDAIIILKELLGEETP